MSRCKGVLTLAAVVCAVLIAPSAQGLTILYVDDDASLGGDGFAWPTAYKYLQDALAVAIAGDEIRIAGGIYRPDRDEVGNVTSGDRFATFQLINGVAVSGGYRGCPNGNCQGGAPNERDIVAYETILTGDLNGDDEADFVNRGDNSYHVVIGSETDATAVLAGLTISGGNADGEIPSDTRFGGGMHNVAGSPVLVDVSFYDNWATAGGAMHNVASNPQITRCAFLSNEAGLGAGAILNREASSPVLSDCMFVANVAELAAGAMDNIDASNPTMNRCTFIQNSAPRGFGGAVRIHESNANIIECEFIENEAKHAGAIQYQFSAGILVDCLFDGNSATTSAGAIHISASSTTMINCAFRGNGTSGRGGVFLIEGSAVPLLVNCVFNGNLAGQGSAIYNNNGFPILTNCTLVGNRVLVESGTVVNNNQSIVTLTNGILWDNTDVFGAAVPQIVSDPTSTALASYSCIQSVDSEGVFPGQGNIDDDPLFVDYLGLDGTAGTADDDLRLLPGSPCVDAGDSDAVPPDTADLDGDGDATEPTSLDASDSPRLTDDSCTPDSGNGASPIVDMGALEYAGDCNGNAIPDACDVDCTSAECLATGWVGDCGDSSDCDGNCFPDECVSPAPSSPQNALNDVQTNRYIGFRMTEPGEQTAISVTLSDLPAPHDGFNGIALWVGQPTDVSENGGSVEPISGFANFRAATLQCQPFFTDWSLLGSVHVYHEALVPGAIYEIRAIREGCASGIEGNYSARLVLTTGRWGDLVGPLDNGVWGEPNGTVEVSMDIVALLDKFAGRPGAPTKVRADLEPAVPNQIINISDITRDLDAFRGIPFPFEPGPIPCDK